MMEIPTNPWDTLDTAGARDIWGVLPAAMSIDDEDELDEDDVFDDEDDDDFLDDDDEDDFFDDDEEDEDDDLLDDDEDEDFDYFAADDN